MVTQTHGKDIEEFGKDKEDWFSSFLELPNGIPSHDTFYRVFCMLNPDKFQQCLIDWIKSTFYEKSGQSNQETDIVPIDGKTLRGSRSKAKDKKGIHIIHAGSTKLSLVLGQLKVDSKTNEITAIPDLLKQVDIKGCLITADALNSAKKVSLQLV